MNVLTQVVGTVIEDSPFFVMMRILGIAGTPINQASVTSIIAKLYQVSGATPATPLQTVTLAVGDVVFDTYQTDSRWTKDGIGYNFGHAVPGAWLDTGSVTYDIEYRITPMIGDPFYCSRVRMRTEDFQSS